MRNAILLRCRSALEDAVSVHSSRQFRAFAVAECRDVACGLGWDVTAVRGLDTLRVGLCWRLAGVRVRGVWWSAEADADHEVVQGREH